MAEDETIVAFDEWLMKSYWAVALYIGHLEEALADWRRWQEMFETAYLNGDYTALAEIYVCDREEVGAIVQQYEHRAKTRSDRARRLPA